jgi:hypothetical protein
MALGVSTCPSPDPIDANIERKLHDADAALVHIKAATRRGRESSSQYFLFRERSESLVRSVEGDFIECPSVLKIGLGARDCVGWSFGGTDRIRI